MVSKKKVDVGVFLSKMVKSPWFFVGVLAFVCIVAGIILYVITRSTDNIPCDLKTHDYIEGSGCLMKCPPEKPKRCGNMCYDPKKQKCSGGILCVLCNPDDQQCCNGTCSPDPQNTGKNICCGKAQTCVVNGQTTCCGAGTICDNGQCRPICGPPGSTRLCDPGNTCFVSENIVPGTELYKQFISDQKSESAKQTDGNYTFYTCLNDTGKAGCSNSLAPYSVPIPINGHYPCFNIETQKSGVGMGFCTAKDINKQADIDSCKAKNESDCGQDSNCKWYNLIDTNNNDPTSPNYFNTIDTVVKATYPDIHQGLYCGSQGQRVIGTKFTGDKCDAHDCLLYATNPQVADIKYDDLNKTCTAVYNCKAYETPVVNYTYEVDKNNRIPKSYFNYPGESVTGIINDKTDIIMPDCNTPEADVSCKRFTTPTSDVTCNNGSLIKKADLCYNGGTWNVDHCDCQKVPGQPGLYANGGPKCELKTPDYCGTKGIGFESNGVNDPAPTCRCTYPVFQDKLCKNLLQVNDMVQTKGYGPDSNGYKMYMRNNILPSSPIQTGMTYIMPLQPDKYKVQPHCDGQCPKNTQDGGRCCNTNGRPITYIDVGSNTKAGFAYPNPDFGNPVISFDIVELTTGKTLNTDPYYLYMPTGQKDFTVSSLPTNSGLSTMDPDTSVQTYKNWAACIVGLDMDML